MCTMPRSFLPSPPDLIAVPQDEMKTAGFQIARGLLLDLSFAVGSMQVDDAKNAVVYGEGGGRGWVGMDEGVVAAFAGWETCKYNARDSNMHNITRALLPTCPPQTPPRCASCTAASSRRGRCSRYTDASTRVGRVQGMQQLIGGSKGVSPTGVHAAKPNASLPSLPPCKAVVSTVERVTPPARVSASLERYSTG